jgi:hypothetical protein
MIKEVQLLGEIGQLMYFTFLPFSKIRSVVRKYGKEIGKTHGRSSVGFPQLRAPPPSLFSTALMPLKNR